LYEYINYFNNRWKVGKLKCHTAISREIILGSHASTNDGGCLRLVSRGSKVFHVFPFLLCTLSLRLGEGRRQSGVASLQRTLGFILVLVLTSLGGFGVSRGDFSIDGSFLGKKRA
jgi:hypothetical protein